MNSATLKGRTFCGVGSWATGERYDVVVVGIPSSAGSLASSRASEGPELIRRVSSVLAHRSTEMTGWYDFALDRTLCQGLHIADAGDLAVVDESGDRPSNGLMGRLESIRRTCRLLIVLAGDDSWTYEVMAAQRGRLLHLDAHEDRNPHQNGNLNHANFIRRLLQDQPALVIGQWGRRGLSPERPEDSGPKYRPLCSESAALEFLRAAEDAGVHIALDIDVVNPSEISSITCPLPGGPSLAALEALCQSAVGLRTLCISEFAPRGDQRSLVEAYAITQMLLRVIDATVDRG